MEYIDYLIDIEEILKLKEKASYKGRHGNSLLGGYLVPQCKPYRELFFQKIKEFKIKYEYKESLYELLNIIKKEYKFIKKGK